MYGIGMQELLLILLIVVVIFGAKKLPEIGGGLGRVYRSTKVNGVEYQYVLAQGDIQENEITWQQDNYQFVLSSKIDPNVLQEMAISVKK